MNQPCLVIMAAGMGSRFGGPKQTTPVDEYGHFLLHYSLFDAYRAGFRKVVFVVKEDTAEEFRESVGPAVAAAFDVRYAYQKLDTLPAGYAVPAGRTKPWSGSSIWMSSVSAFFSTACTWGPYLPTMLV